MRRGANPRRFIPPFEKRRGRCFVRVFESNGFSDKRRPPSIRTAGAGFAAAGLGFCMAAGVQRTAGSFERLSAISASVGTESVIVPSWNLS